jgi:hypothetical protein
MRESARELARAEGWQEEQEEERGRAVGQGVACGLLLVSAMWVCKLADASAFLATAGGARDPGLGRAEGKE